MKPTRKVNAAGAGGAVGILATFILSQFGIELDPVTAGAMATIGAYVGGYFRREIEVVPAVSGGLNVQATKEEPNSDPLFEG